MLLISIGDNKKLYIQFRHRILNFFLQKKSNSGMNERQCDRDSRNLARKMLVKKKRVDMYTLAV